MANTRRYVIIGTEEVESIDYSQILETSIRTLRLSQDGEYTFVKFEGLDGWGNAVDTPSFLNGKTQYSHSEIKEILYDSDGIWHIDISEEPTWRETARVYFREINWSKANPFNWF